MVPITLKRNNILDWIVFGLIDLWRMIVAFLTRRGSREAQVADYVCEHVKEGDAEGVLKAMDTFAKERHFLMNVGDEKGLILDETLQQAKATRVLELGCYCGYSAVRTGRILAERGGSLVSLEKSPEFAEIARRVVQHAGLSDVVEIQVGAADERIPHLTGTFDVVFIDHWKDAYLPDLKRLEEGGHLAPGSIVVADNVGIFESTLQPYLNYVRTSDQYRSEHHATRMEYNADIEDGVEVSVWLGAPA